MKHICEFITAFPACQVVIKVLASEMSQFLRIRNWQKSRGTVLDQLEFIWSDPAVPLQKLDGGVIIWQLKPTVEKHSSYTSKV